MKPGEEKKNQGQKKNSGKDLRKPEKGTETKNDTVAEGKLPNSKVAELLRKLMGDDEWGRLPKKLQEDVGSVNAREFPREYREIISRYYKRMAEVLSRGDK